MCLSSNRNSLLALALGAVAAVSGPFGPARASSNSQCKPDGDFRITNVRVFDGERTIEHSSVSVRAGLIESVGTDAPRRPTTCIVDGSGQTLLPGLIDAHVHFSPGAQEDALRFGVTTELDMFNSDHAFPRWRAQRTSLGRTDAADSWSAGTGVTVEGGHPTEMGGPKIPVLASAAGAARFVDDREAEGSDYIKLILEDGSEYGPKVHFSTLTPDEIKAVVDEATRLGKLTIAHIARRSDAELALRLGVRGLAHVFMDQPVDNEFLQLVQKMHPFVVATLAIQAGSSGKGQAEALRQAPEVSPLLSIRQKATLSLKWPSLHPERLATAEANVRALFRAGVPILAGTDAPTPAEAHGVSLHEELALLVESGLTPQEALSAATARPAAVFGLWDRGRVRAGMRADLLLIDGDPTADISRSTHITQIWKNGFLVRREPLNSNNR